MGRALVLPGLVALLLVVLLADLALSPLPRVVPTRARAPVAIAAAQAGPSGASVAREAGAILGRPLFSQSRRPYVERVHVAANAVDPRLSAIFVTPGARRAVFDDGGAKPLVATVGGHAGPFEIVSIAPDQVVVDASGQRRTLRPTPKPAGAADSTADAQAHPPDTGLSLLQQLQRTNLPRYPVQPPPSIQGLLERLQHPTRE